MSSYFLILNGGMEHLSMKKKLLELDMLKQQQKKKNVLQVGFIIDILQQETAE